MKEAVSEIKEVAKSDPVTSGDGAVSLMQRIWPALQGIDGSSGALRSAVNRTLETARVHACADLGALATRMTPFT